MVLVWISHYKDWNLFCYFCWYVVLLLICSSTLWLNVILYCLLMYFLLLNVSVLLAKVWSHYLQQQSSSMCSCIQVREAHKYLLLQIKGYFLCYYCTFYFANYPYLNPCFVRLGLILLQSLQVRTLQSVCRRLRSMSVEDMFEIICF